MKKVLLMVIFGILLSSSFVFAEDSVSGEALEELGLIEGNGISLNEEGLLTKEALMKILVSLTRDLNVTFELPESPTFKDVPKEHWSYYWVERAYFEGLTKGIGNDLFGLGVSVTKQQFSAYMLNLLNESYDYNDVLKIIMDKGLSTSGSEEFYRVHAFEMLHHTLLEKPVSMDLPLYKSIMNFQDKNFENIVNNVVESRKPDEELVKKALIEEEEKLLVKEKMTNYRLTWPNSEKVLNEWVVDMEDILQPYWEEITYDEYIRDNGNYKFFLSDDNHNFSLIVSDNYGEIIIKNVDSNSYVERNSWYLHDMKVYSVKEYGAIKMEGIVDGESFKMFYVLDSNLLDLKGYVNINDLRYTSLMLDHHTYIKMFNVISDQMGTPNKFSSYSGININQVQKVLSEDLSFYMIMTKVIKINGENVTFQTGLDQYLIKLSHIIQEVDVNGNVIKTIEVKKSFDNESEIFKITFIRMSDDEKRMRIECKNESDEDIEIMIELNDNYEVKSAYIESNIFKGSYEK